MPIIANTTSSNTFSAVRSQLNLVTRRINQFSVNESAIYANTVTANVSFRISGTLLANSSAGTSGYYLRTSGTGVYWSPMASQTQYLQVSNAVATYATKANPTTSGLLAHTGRVTISTNLAVSGNTTLSGTLVANGSTGTSGYYLRTSGTGVYWSPASSGSFTGGTVAGATSFTNATAAANNTSGAVTVTGGVGVSDSLYVKNRVGIANTTGKSSVYMVYNNTTKSLDTIFG